MCASDSVQTGKVSWTYLLLGGQGRDMAVYQYCGESMLFHDKNWCLSIVGK